MLNFSKFAGYPMLQYQDGDIKDNHLVYSFIHNTTPEIGEEAISCRLKQNMILKEIISNQPVRSSHHQEPVMVYKGVFEIVKNTNR